MTRGLVLVALGLALGIGALAYELGRRAALDGLRDAEDATRDAIREADRPSTPGRALRLLCAIPGIDGDMCEQPPGADGPREGADDGADG